MVAMLSSSGTAVLTPPPPPPLSSSTPLPSPQTRTNTALAETLPQRGSAQHGLVHSTLAQQHNTPLDPPLLQLPVHVLLLICDLLETPEALVLALSCKSIYSLRHAIRQCKVPMRPNERRRFLLLLEQDPGMGLHVFYCHSCNSLHPFAYDWGPRSASEERAAPARPHHCGVRDCFAPDGNAFGLSYHHARLVVNEHLFGPDRGLPLANLCVSHIEKRPGTTIHCSTEARIVGGELMLLRTYAFAVAAADVALFRRGGGPRDFRLCQHTCFFPHSSSSPYRQHVPQLQPPPSRRCDGGGDDDDVAAFSACHDCPGSCGLCLMDYTLTITAIAPQISTSRAWAITIKAYHQLGACRSPDDWKWARFSEANRPHLFYPNCASRRTSSIEPGTVRRRWLGEPRSMAADGNLTRSSVTTSLASGAVAAAAATALPTSIAAAASTASRSLTSLPWRSAKPLSCAESC